MNEIVKKLKNIDEESLSGEEQIDRDLAIHFLKLRNFELKELRMVEKVSMASEMIGASLLFLFVRSCPPFEQRMQSITARLREVPRFLKDSQDSLKTPYRLWNEIQCETGDGIRRFLDEIDAFCETKSENLDIVRAMKAAVKEASAAIKEHNDWLRKDILPVASEKNTIGPDLYGRYLQMKDFGVNADETLRMAELHLEDVNRKKREVSRKLVSSGMPHEALRKMRGDHQPTFAEVLEEYRSSVLEAREFIKKKRLVSVPHGEKLHVMETPSFMRHLNPYAAQYEPGRFDDDTNGFLFVTPDDGKPAMLEEHCHAAIVNTSVHEGYPGHHLHGICMNMHPSYIRPLYQSLDFAEGWGLYCEDMMLSEGYHDDPTGRLTILNDLAFRIARQICDVKLSTGVMTVDQAAEFISAQTETSLKAATSEAMAIALYPTYYISYFVGKIGVLQLRDDVQGLMGAKFDLRFFHDALIYSGCMPMPFMRRAVALKLADAYGLKLDEPKESVYEYALRVLGRTAT